jgi:hypothetical protein
VSLSWSHRAIATGEAQYSRVDIVTMKEKRFWLENHPWSSLTNTDPHRRGSRGPNSNINGFGRARDLWEIACSSEISLKEAVEACRSCYALNPFDGNGDNVFISVARIILKPVTRPMSPALAATVQTVVAEYVSGTGTIHELEQVLNLIRFRYLSEA